MSDICVYTGAGGQSNNKDAFRSCDSDMLSAVLIDAGSAPVSGSVADAAAEGALLMLHSGSTPADAVRLISQRLSDAQAKECGLDICPRAAALLIDSGRLTYAARGDVRVYRFSGGRLIDRSEDESAAYAEYLNGAISYEDIRMSPARHTLFCKSGDAAQHSLELAKNDAVLLCSDGFWQYIYETEMEIDLIKSVSAEAWLRYMMLRVVSRSMLDGDNLSALTYFNR